MMTASNGSELARAPSGLPTDACHVRGCAANYQRCDLREEESGGVAGNSLLHAVIDLAVGGHWAEHAHQQKLGSCVGFRGSEFEIGVERGSAVPGAVGEPSDWEDGDWATRVGREGMYGQMTALERANLPISTTLSIATIVTIAFVAIAVDDARPAVEGFGRGRVQPVSL
jgi:hypothetical protein